MMPLPQLWSVCFFLMIIMLGLDTQVRRRHAHFDRSPPWLIEVLTPRVVSSS